MRKTELLSPCGTYEAVYSAINANADAIYLGGSDFNARSSSKSANFTNEEIKDIVKLCKTYGVKVYLTVNTLFKDEEFERLEAFLDEMYIAGVDAFIIQDIGLLDLIKTKYKGVAVHASTQMSAHSLLDVLYLKDLGFDRVVVAREMSLLEMKTIKENVDIELEVFVHGALCVSYSGQCLMSSLIGGRSGNRGKCAQPCRKKLALYDTVTDEKIMDGFLLSPKDISQIDNLDEIIEVGVDSLKIEGRMKSPEYVYQTTKIYSDKIDGISFDRKDAKKRLLGVFNRGGEHSNGYLGIHSSKSIMSVETPKATGTFLGTVTDYNKVSGKCVIKLADDVFCGDGIEIWTKTEPHVGTNISKEAVSGQNMQVIIKGDIKVNDKVYKSYNKTLIDELKVKYKKITRKNEIEAKFTCKINEPFNFTVKYGDIIVSKDGDIVTETLEKPLTSEVIIEKLSKTGNTPFALKFTDYELSENAFLQLKSINEIKRDVLDELLESITNSVSRELIENKSKQSFFKNEVKENIFEDKKCFSVELHNINNLEEVLTCDFDRLYLHYNNNLMCNIDSVIKKCKVALKDLFIVLPKITTTDSEIMIDDDIALLKEKGVNGFLVSSYGQIVMCEGSDIILDYNFNVLNKRSVLKTTSLEDVISVTISPEATLDEIINMETINSEVIIHTRQVVMETKACPIGLYIADKKNEKYCKYRHKATNYVFRDKMNIDFPIKTNCDTCVCQIYNGNLLFMLDKNFDLKKLKSSLRITITNEESPKRIIDAYINAINNDDDSDTMNVKQLYKEGSLTKGHFYRGIV